MRLGFSLPTGQERARESCPTRRSSRSLGALCERPRERRRSTRSARNARSSGEKRRSPLGSLLGGFCLPTLAVGWRREKNGSSGRARTYDPAVNSRLLCQLSYAGMWARRLAALAPWSREIRHLGAHGGPGRRATARGVPRKRAARERLGGELAPTAPEMHAPSAVGRPPRSTPHASPWTTPAGDHTAPPAPLRGPHRAAGAPTTTWATVAAPSSPATSSGAARPRWGASAEPPPCRAPRPSAAAPPLRAPAAAFSATRNLSPEILTYPVNIDFHAHPRPRFPPPPPRPLPPPRPPAAPAPPPPAATPPPKS